MRRAVSTSTCRAASLPRRSNFLGGGERWVSLSSGFGMRREINGTLYLTVGHVITRYDRSPRLLDPAVPYRSGPAGSVSVEHACRDLTNSLVVGIEPALAVFLEHVENLG
jgi:hypothetical protein